MFNKLSVVVSSAPEGRVDAEKLPERKRRRNSPPESSRPGCRPCYRGWISRGAIAYSVNNTDSHVEENRLDCNVDRHVCCLNVKRGLVGKRKHEANEERYCE